MLNPKGKLGMLETVARMTNTVESLYIMLFGMGLVVLSFQGFGNHHEHLEPDTTSFSQCCGVLRWCFVSRCCVLFIFWKG